MHVAIDYCEACGGLGMAIEVRDALESDCPKALDRVELRPVDDGSFRVFVDGREVFTTDTAEYDPARVTQSVCKAGK
jgi:selT/selW/selH-like putative selenoprotein